MSHYVDKVKEIIDANGLRKDPRIFLMTEDYRALDEFKAAADPRWKVQVYEPAVFPRDVDLHETGPSKVQYEHVEKGNTDVGTNSLVALFMSLESKYYVGATGSNWARLMNELRQSRNMYSPDCHGCTVFHDINFFSGGYGKDMDGKKNADGSPIGSYEWRNRI